MKHGLENRNTRRIRGVAFVFVVWAMVCVSNSWGQGRDGVCSGLVYKTKKDEVPVFAEPELTAEVIARLSVGEKVCYVGEEKEFAIIDWRSITTDRKRNEKKDLAYVRLVDLWAPALPPSGDPVDSFFERAKRYMKYLLAGGVPEDPLLPYRPLLNPLEDSKDAAQTRPLPNR